MDIPPLYPGLVIHYDYLWHDESLEGRENARKSRPCAIVLVKNDNHVMVVPITHSPPKDPATAVEIPTMTKKRLGMDDERSWIVCSELNQFIWPGPDLKTLKHSSTTAYGHLPRALYQKILTRIRYVAQGRKLKIVTRTP